MKGEPTGHVCPDCGEPLVIRLNRSTETEFLGCSTYPECRFTTPVPADLVMRRAGAKPLPGFN
jgi:ssDNA-binding Zn-finger/Zn-ribbon topoisomerase 1